MLKLNFMLVGEYLEVWSKTHPFVPISQHHSLEAPDVIINSAANNCTSKFIRKTDEKRQLLLNIFNHTEQWTGSNVNNKRVQVKMRDLITEDRIDDREIKFIRSKPTNCILLLKMVTLLFHSQVACFRISLYYISI